MPNALEYLPTNAAVDFVLQATDEADLQDRMEEMFVNLGCGADAPPEQEPRAWAALIDLPYDIRIPIAARETFVQIIRGLLAGAILARVMTTERRVAPWVSTALAATYEAALRDMIRGAGLLLPVLAENGYAAFERHFKAKFAEAGEYVAYLESFYSPKP